MLRVCSLEKGNDGYRIEKKMKARPRYDVFCVYLHATWSLRVCWNRHYSIGLVLAWVSLIWGHTSFYCTFLYSVSHTLFFCPPPPTNRFVPALLKHVYWHNVFNSFCSLWVLVSQFLYSCNISNIFIIVVFVIQVSDPYC